MEGDKELANLLAKAEGKEPVETTEAPPAETVEKEEAPAPSQEEQKPEAEKAEAEEPAQNKEVPFHKHPRWIRQQQEKEELKAKLEALEQRLSQQEKPTVKEEKKQMPESFVKLFGENEEAWNEWQRLREMDKADARAEVQKLFEEQQAEARKVEEKRSQALKWAEDQFLTLSEETGIEFTETSNTERNQILDICDKYELFTPNGLPNIQAANQLREALYPKKDDAVEAKKSIAAKTSTKTNSGAKESDVWTPAKIRAVERRGGAVSLL